MANVAMRVALGSYKGGTVCMEEMASTAPISTRFFEKRNVCLMKVVVLGDCC